MPLDGDIGRVKLPKMLRQIAGEELKIENTAGTDFPSDLSKYALVITAAAVCLTENMSSQGVYLAKNQNVPVTNYGIAIAKIKGILDKIKY